MARSYIVWTMLLSFCFAASQGCGDEKARRDQVSDKYAPAPASTESAGTEPSK